MSYPISTSTNTLILTTNFNNIQSVVQDIFGLGINGYGQTDFNSRPVTRKFTVHNNSWSELIETFNKIYKHQNNQDYQYLGNTVTDITLAPNSATSGTLITRDLHNAINSATQVLLTNRYTIHPSQLEPLVTTFGESTRQASWTGTKIEHNVQVTWLNSLAARYFFNLGGYLTITADHENNSSGGNNDAWKSIIAAVNSAALTYTRSDFVGAQTKNYTPIYGTVPYDTLEYKVTAIRLSTNSVLFKVTFFDSAVAPPSDSVVVIPSSASWGVEAETLGSFTPVATMPGQGTYSDQGASDSDVTLTVKGNGTFSIKGRYLQANYDANWGSPTLNVGSQYWVRFTLQSNLGTNGRSTTQSTGWLALTTNRSVTARSYVITGQGESTQVSTYLVEIASDSGGSTVVSSGTYILDSRAVASLFTPAATLPGQGTYSEIDIGTISVTLRFNPNASIECFSETTVNAATLTSNLLNSEWGSPQTDDIGSYYWIRFTKTGESIGSSGTTDASASTGWLSLSSAKSITVTVIPDSSGIATRTTTYTVEISDLSDGSNIVGTGSYTLSASGSPPASINLDSGGNIRDPIDEREER